MINHSRSILPETMFAKAQNLMEEHIVRPHQPVWLYTSGAPHHPVWLYTSGAPHQPVWLYTSCASNQTIFVNHEPRWMMDDMKQMNENIKSHEEWRLKEWRMMLEWNWVNMRTQNKTPKIPTLSTKIVLWRHRESNRNLSRHRWAALNQLSH